MIAHRSTGLRKILDWDFFYRFFQWAIGDYKLYRHIIGLLPSLDNKNILDVGCGNGRLLDFLPETVNYTGLDFNPRYIKKAQRRYRDRNAKFFVADINDMKNSMEADVVFAIGVLHHLTDEACKKLLRSAEGFLNLPGIMVTVDPVLAEKQNPIARRLIKSDRGACTRSAEGYLNLSHDIFSAVSHHLFRNITNIPYNHILIINQK